MAPTLQLPITAQTTKPKYPVSNLQTGNTTNTAQTIPQAQLAASSAIPFQSGITGKMADIGGKISNFLGSFTNKFNRLIPHKNKWQVGEQRLILLLILNKQIAITCS